MSCKSPQGCNLLVHTIFGSTIFAGFALRLLRRLRRRRRLLLLLRRLLLPFWSRCKLRLGLCPTHADSCGRALLRSSRLSGYFGILGLLASGWSCCLYCG